MKSYAEFDVVDYIEATEDEREEIDGEFAGQPAELEAMHVFDAPKLRDVLDWHKFNKEVQDAE